MLISFVNYLKLNGYSKITLIMVLKFKKFLRNKNTVFG